jgi:hypothetical protein
MHDGMALMEYNGKKDCEQERRNSENAKKAKENHLIFYQFPSFFTTNQVHLQTHQQG